MATTESAIDALQSVVTARYLSGAGFVVLLYDHALTLADEVQYIWSAPSTLAKILFLLLRYMVPLFMLMETITRSGVSYVAMSDNACKGITAFATYAGWLSIAISNFLVLLRIWTLLPRGHRLIAWSLIFFAAIQAVSLGLTTVVVAKMAALMAFEPHTGLCVLSTLPRNTGFWVAGIWAIGLFFEIVVFAAVCWHVLARPRPRAAAGDAVVRRLLFRDGVIYFLVLFALRVTNTVLAITSPISSLYVIVFFIWCMTTLTTSRLIINARRAAAHRRCRALALRSLTSHADADADADEREDCTDSTGGCTDRERERERDSASLGLVTA